MQTIAGKKYTKAEVEEIKRLMLEKARLDDGLLRYEHDNKIEFFGVRNEARIAAHKECCKLFRGMNPVQQKLFDAWENPFYKVFTMSGGNRLGKTTSGAVMAISTAIGKFLWSGRDIKFPHKHPRKIRYIGQDWEKHIKTVIEPELHKWWPKNRKLTTKKNNFGVDAMWIDEATGSTIELMSNLQDKELHEGWFGDLIVYDEPCKRDIRVANSRGLVDRGGRELFTMTLLKEAWIHREVIKATNDDGTPDMTVFNVHGEIYDNVGFGLSEENIAQFSKTLRPEERDARLRGIPSYMSGLIFDKFNRQKHVKDRFRIPLDWIVDISIDFHPSKPWAILFVATDRHNFKYCIEEIWQHGSWKAIGEEIIRRIKRNDYRVGRILIDPLSKGDEQSDLNEESVFDKLSTFFIKYGYPLFTASKDKEGGIHMIKDLLFTENEMPALFVFKDLKHTIQEFEDWMIDPKTGKPSKEQEDDMMENLYRLILLDTQYTEPEFEDDLEPAGNVKRNPITGY